MLPTAATASFAPAPTLYLAGPNACADARAGTAHPQAHPQAGGQAGGQAEEGRAHPGHRRGGAYLREGPNRDQSSTTCIDYVWTRESKWNPRAGVPSGAYGIPQAFPGSKMARFGSNWRTSPLTQVKWGPGT